MATHTEDWRSFAQDALDIAVKAGATYADIRIHPEDRTQVVEVEDGEVTAVGESETSGFGVRVIADGAWGFYATDDLRRERIADITKRAVENARANAQTRKRPVELLPLREDEIGREYTYNSPFEIDPFGVPLGEKVKLLFEADRAMREVDEKIFKRVGHLSAYRFRKIFANTPDRIFADQTFTRIGASINAMAQRDESDLDKQSCSYPSHFPVVMQQGWESVLAFNLVDHARRIAQEAVEFLYAPETPTGVRHIILQPEQHNLHGTHETIHGIEEDRVLHKEHSLAGGSFVTRILSQIGTYRFGSDIVNIVADSVTPGGVGTFACDDEGIPAKRTVLVENGILVGLLGSRESRAEVNRVIGRPYFTEASGAMRASSYSSFPLIRMNNITFLPGSMSYEELLDRAPVGTIMFGNNKSWSIDPERRDFLFGSERGWEKVRKNGSMQWEKRRNPIYHGDNLKFFHNYVAAADRASMMLLGIGNCGKGVPVQSMATGHCTPPVLIKDISVGSAREV